MEIKTTEEKITAAVKLFLAVKKICEDNDFKAVAFSCWPKLNELNLAGCLTVSLLDSLGVPAGCEGDMLSTISMLILRILSGKPTAVMDLPVFDEEDDSVLLWHCGAAPFEMANKRGVICRNHYRSEFASEESFENLAPVTDVIYPPGANMTSFRLTRESDYFYYFAGKGLDESKKMYNGSRGWFGDLTLNGEPVKAIDLVNTILNSGIQHHFPMVLQNVGKYIEEFAYWLGLKKVLKNEYKDYLYS